MFALGALFVFFLIKSGAFAVSYLWVIPLLILEILVDIHLYFFIRSGSPRPTYLPEVDK